MASYNAVPESEQLLNKTPKTKSWKRIAAGAAVASFVLGCLAVTAVKSSVGLRGATSLKHHKTGTMQIKLISDPSKCLAVMDHHDVGPGTELEIYDCRSDWDTHDEGQAFTYEINDEGNVGTIQYAGYCVSVRAKPEGMPFEGNYFHLEYCRHPGDVRQNLVWDINDVTARAENQVFCRVDPPRHRRDVDSMTCCAGDGICHEDHLLARRAEYG